MSVSKKGSYFWEQPIYASRCFHWGADLWNILRITCIPQLRTLLYNASPFQVTGLRFRAEDRKFPLSSHKASSGLGLKLYSQDIETWKGYEGQRLHVCKTTQVVRPYGKSERSNATSPPEG